jgi:ribonuclease HI
VVINVYTDDSFVLEAPRVGFVGSGVWPWSNRPAQCGTASATQEGDVQTVHRAKLSACIVTRWVVLRTQPPRVISDSKYVYDSVLYTAPLAQVEVAREIILALGPYRVGAVIRGGDLSYGPDAVAPCV